MGHNIILTRSRVILQTTDASVTITRDKKAALVPRVISRIDEHQTVIRRYVHGPRSKRTISRPRCRRENTGLQQCGQGERHNHETRIQGTKTAGTTEVVARGRYAKYMAYIGNMHPTYHRCRGKRCQSRSPAVVHSVNELSGLSA